jgi:ADP-heptose:LPS heptosyltransferase
MKIIGYFCGQVGDLVIQTPLIRQFKQENPNCNLILGIGNKYKQVVPLFYNSPYIDDIHLWDSYEDWPNENDFKYIKQEKFNIIYGGMPNHTEDYWYLYRHYAQEFGEMYGMKIKNLQCELDPWFGKLDNCDKIVTLSMFPSMDVGQKKSLSIEQLEKLCIEVKKLGYLPFQLGGKYEPKLENAERPDMSLIQAAQLLYSSKLHLTCDTSFGWISSAYQHKTIGFYTNNLPFMTEEASKNIQPINPNAYYFHRDNLANLQIDEIIIKIQDYVKS